MPSDSLVSIGLPVRNGAGRLERAVRSVLAQDHQNLELVICDNASTDKTEEVCRALADSDPRVRYHRQPRNVGVLGNFETAARIAEGTFFRWISDDDWLEPAAVSAALRAFEQDERLILVTTKIAYTDPDGVTRTGDYDGTALRSGDPVERFTEMLRMLNESHLMIDPLYGLFRRAPMVAIRRRNMLREDEVFATKLALAGPWGHVPELLGHRNWKHENIRVLARRLDVPAWQAHVATTLQCREMLGWLGEIELTSEQRSRARAAVYRMYARRQRRTAAHRSRKLVRIATGRA